MKLTTEQVKQAILSVADRNPDHISAEPRYVVEGKPSCIIGHAFFELGLDLERISDLEGPISKEWAEISEDIVVDPKNPDNFWIESVQNLQDQSRTWSYSASNAHRYVV